MTYGKWLFLVGGVLLLLGLVLALISTRLASRAMRKTSFGMPGLPPAIGSPEWREKVRLRATADRWFWVGIVLTACGIVLQTLGGILR